MHNDNLANVRRLEPICHRILSPVSSRHDPNWCIKWCGHHALITGQRRRHHQNDLVHRMAPIKSRHSALEYGNVT
jgi:hypothetical protein